MKIVLATGIYPPTIGGPATYVYELSKQLVRRGFNVHILTYGEHVDAYEPCPVTRVSLRGGPLARWWRFAKALRAVAGDADVVYAFSSVSVGVPLWAAHLRHPRTVLRLGGDFLWERYTDRGGSLGLKDWYAQKPWFQSVMNGLLTTFDHIVFSTPFQQELYERTYARLPLHSVIENALPAGTPVLHQKHDPMRLLYLGRFVAFKNLGSLFLALQELPGMMLTLVGSGPLESTLKKLASDLHLEHRVTFETPRSGEQKQQCFLEHDLLVLPSYTELSPNTALEARSVGLPVLLTEETGLSSVLNDGCSLRVLRAPHDIVAALKDIDTHYVALAERAARPLPERGWQTVGDEHAALFQSLL
jgi:glycosyltransferase involved in cell wall biosynthesis